MCESAAALHGLHAGSQDRIDTWRIIEYFDTYPTAVLDVMQSLKNGCLIDIPHAWSKFIWVVRVKVQHQVSLIPDNLIDRNSLGAHGFYVQVQSDGGASDRFDHRAGFRSMVKKVSFLRSERFDR